MTLSDRSTSYFFLLHIFQHFYFYGDSKKYRICLLKKKFPIYLPLSSFFKEIIRGSLNVSRIPNTAIFFSLVKIKVFFNKSRFSIIKALLIAHLVVLFTRRVKCISRSDNKVSWLTLEALQQIRTRCYRMIRAILLIKNKSKISILSKRDQALF